MIVRRYAESDLWPAPVTKLPWIQCRIWSSQCRQPADVRAAELTRSQPGLANATRSEVSRQSAASGDLLRGRIATKRLSFVSTGFSGTRCRASLHAVSCFRRPRKDHDRRHEHDDGRRPRMISDLSAPVQQPETRSRRRRQNDDQQFFKPSDRMVIETADKSRFRTAIVSEKPPGGRRQPPRERHPNVARHEQELRRISSSRRELAPSPACSCFSPSQRRTMQPGRAWEIGGFGRSSSYQLRRTDSRPDTAPSIIPKPPTR